MLELVVATFILPLLGFALNSTLGRNEMISKKIVQLIAISTVGLSFLCSLILFFSIPSSDLQQGVAVHLYSFLKIDQLQLDMGVLVDSLSLLFMLVITGIGSMIHLFSLAYMEEETNRSYSRYFSYLNLFIFFMLVLVMGSNLLMTFVGWEGVGLCSYLLIGFWFKKPEYVTAANKAFTMNRIGDLALLIASFLLVYYFKTLDYQSLQTSVVSGSVVVPASVITLIGLLLFFAATGKSAQIPLFTWLPDAMAGPTPVSALIHAATMVTAGVFLMVRFFYLVNLSTTLQEVMLVIGTLTALVTATTATVQKDIKKVLAYSTVSQLGFMVAALGASAYVSSVFHVFTHAFFKALLFLGSGSIIYVLHHEQLMGNMGGLKKYLPITHITFLIACLSIAGIPPFAGFFSKDEILASLFVHHTVFYVLLQATALITTFYMFRLYTLVFLGEYRGKMDVKHIKEGSPLLTIPLLVLSVGVIVVGWLGVPPMIGEMFHIDHALNSFLAPWASHGEEMLSHSTEWALTGFAVVSSLIVMIVTIVVYSKKATASQEGEPSGLTAFFFNYWYIDSLYKKVIQQPLKQFSNFLYYQIDISLVRNVPSWMESISLYVGGRLRLLQAGYISTYLLWMVVCLSIIILSLVFVF